MNGNIESEIENTVGAVAQPCNTESRAQKMDAAINEIENVVASLDRLADRINPRPKANEKTQEPKNPKVNLYGILSEGPDRIYDSLGRAHALIDEIRALIL